jgi:hypothetical protein
MIDLNYRSWLALLPLLKRVLMYNINLNLTSSTGAVADAFPGNSVVGSV